MRALVQCVSEAKVVVDGQTVGAIDKGFLVLLGVGHADGEEQACKLWAKISKMRVFEDEAGKTNLSLADIGGSVLVVSQFTLFANCKKGNRPSFTDAAAPERAEELYGHFLDLARQTMEENGTGHVACGRFGAMMDVSLVNHGPFTIWLDTDTL